MMNRKMDYVLKNSKKYFLIFGTIIIVWMFFLVNLVYGKELKVADLKIGESVYTGVDGNGGYEARMFDKNGVDLYNKNGPKIVTTYDENGNAINIEEWTKEKRMYVRNNGGDLANVYCVQHGTLFGIGGERITEDIKKIMDQTTLNKIVAAIDYIRSTGVSGQEEYFAVQSFIWSLQDGNESFGYSFGDISSQKHPYESINKVILDQQSDYYFGDYHGKGMLFGSNTEQDVGMFDYTKDTDKNARIKTTARNDYGDSKNIIINDKAVITDKVEYCGLLTTKEYTLKGLLVKRPSAEILKIGDKAVTAEAKFTPKTTACAIANVKFEFDASSLKEDDSLVVYEELWRSGRKILEHKDVFDDAQTVRLSNKEEDDNKISVKVNVMNSINNQNENNNEFKSKNDLASNLDDNSLIQEDVSAVKNSMPTVPRTGYVRRTE